MPRPDASHSSFTKFCYKWVPGFMLAVRYAIFWAFEFFWLVNNRSYKRQFKPAINLLAKYMRRQVKSDKLKKVIIPNYELGCKRALLSNAYLPALNRSNVNLITEGILKINEHSITTKNNEELETDIIIYATGF